eukprot:jgi/Psemu1/284715/fgenesh1_pg.62_\
MTKTSMFCCWPRQWLFLWVAMQLLFWVASRAPTQADAFALWTATKKTTTTGTVLGGYPRAAVAVAVRCLCRAPNPAGNDDDDYHHHNPPEPFYLLIRRGNEPSKGSWALPGGKLEWGETTLEGAKRELAEEIVFFKSSGGSDSDIDSNGSNSGAKPNPELDWSPRPYTTTDAIVGDRFHYLIAVCFAELLLSEPDDDNGSGGDGMVPPSVQAADDATDARWWSLRELVAADVGVTNSNTDTDTNTNTNTNTDSLLPEGRPSSALVERLQWTEQLYKAGLLWPNEACSIAQTNQPSS